MRNVPLKLPGWLKDTGHTGPVADSNEYQRVKMASEKQREKTDWSNQDDTILVKAHLRGDKTAFEVLFKKYREMVGRLVFSILKDDSRVDDTVQDVFVLLFRNLSKFRGQSALKTWIYRITVNEALRQINRSKRWVQMPEGDVEPSQIPSAIVVFKHGASPERVLIEGEQRDIIQRGLSQLKPDHRVILTLYYLEDLSVQDLSSVLEIPEGSVKSRLFYARESLKKALGPIIGQMQSEDTGESHVV